MHQQKAEVFLSWMTFLSYLSVLQNVNPEQFNPLTSRRVLLHRTSGSTASRSNHRSGIQVARARCQDARATAARMSLKVAIADSMHVNNREHFTKIVAVTYEKNIYILLNLTRWRCFSPHFTSKPQEKYISCKKPTYLACGLPIRLITWLNLTSIAFSNWQRRSWRGFREESPSV